MTPSPLQRAQTASGPRRTNAPRPRLYLVTPVLEATDGFARDLEEALAAGDVASVLLRLAEADERTMISRAQNLAAVVQRHDIALLLDGRPEIVMPAGADGAHLTGIAALRAALPTLKPDRIVGAGGLGSRHDAMLAGEADADYVMFGEPVHGRSSRRPPLEAVVERLAWWAELFQPPCIGYAAEKDEVRPLAEAGADFVAVGDWIWTERGGVDTAVAAANAILAAVAA